MNIGKYFRKTNQGWKNCQLDQEYEDSHTMIRCDATGYGDGAIVGRMEVTWYCRFKGARWLTLNINVNCIDFSWGLGCVL